MQRTDSVGEINGELKNLHCDRNALTKQNQKEMIYKNQFKMMPPKTKQKQKKISTTMFAQKPETKKKSDANHEDRPKIPKSKNFCLDLLIVLFFLPSYTDSIKAEKHLW